MIALRLPARGVPAEDRGTGLRRGGGAARGAGRLSLGLRLEPGQERAVRVSVIIEEGGQEEIRWRDRAALR